MYKGGAVYIMSSPDKTALYTGVTSDLGKRYINIKVKKYPLALPLNIIVWY